MSATWFSAVFTIAYKETGRYVESAESKHLTTNKSWLENLRNPDLSEIVLTKRSKITVECAGNVEIKTISNKHKILESSMSQVWRPMYYMFANL